MSNSPTVDPNDVVKASYQLSQMLAAPTADDGKGRTNTADEYPLLVESLEMLTALPSKLTECRPTDLNNFANVCYDNNTSRGRHPRATSVFKFVESLFFKYWQWRTFLINGGVWVGVCGWGAFVYAFKPGTLTIEGQVMFEALHGVESRK